MRRVRYIQSEMEAGDWSRKERGDDVNVHIRNENSVSNVIGG